MAQNLSEADSITSPTPVSESLLTSMKSNLPENSPEAKEVSDISGIDRSTIEDDEQEGDTFCDTLISDLSISDRNSPINSETSNLETEKVFANLKKEENIKVETQKMDSEIANEAAKACTSPFRRTWYDFFNWRKIHKNFKVD